MPYHFDVRLVEDGVDGAEGDQQLCFKKFTLTHRANCDDSEEMMYTMNIEHFVDMSNNNPICYDEDLQCLYFSSTECNSHVIKGRTKLVNTCNQNELACKLQLDPEYEQKSYISMCEEEIGAQLFFSLLDAGYTSEDTISETDYTISVDLKISEISTTSYMIFWTTVSDGFLPKLYIPGPGAGEPGLFERGDG